MEQEFEFITFKDGGLDFVAVDSLMDWLVEEKENTEMCDGAKSLWDAMTQILTKIKHTSQTEFLPN